jgi:hypothetical protein
MAYATITHSPVTTLREFQAVNAALGDEQPEGRLLHVVGHSTDARRCQCGPAHASC